MSNIYQDITHIVEPIKKSCKLCGFPMARKGESCHPDCRKALAALKKKMQRREGDVNHSEIEWRFEEMKAHAEWLLNQEHRTVKQAIGEGGEDAVLMFRIYLRKVI
jgi:hypothetical protein